MIQRDYNIQRAYRVAIYARMSDPHQNQRSPQQQQDHIQEIIRRYACPWTVVKVYTDSGIKGRYLRRRPGLQALLRDIEVGLVQIDLILVDNFERFGRAEEFEPLRQKLKTHYGVLIVAADNNFADPTGVTGKALGMVEQIRSTEEGRIKGLNVIRGKKDVLRLKRWPGGPVPLGYQLEKKIDNSGPHPRLYSILIVDHQTAWIVRGLFDKAREKGWRGTRLAKWLNADTRIPDVLKPFYAPSVEYMLDNQIYIGVGVWGMFCTDIIADARVVEPNPHPEEVVRVEEFCPPLVAEEVFAAVQAIKAARARPRPAAAADGKLIEPTAGGISLNYVLAGLVKCECGACRVPRPSGRKSKAGTEYTYYVCPRHSDGACPNGHHVREQHLTAAVLGHLRRRLFPQPEETGAVPEWFGGLVQQVQQFLAQLQAGEPRRADESRRRIAKLGEQLAGWSLSLADPSLPMTVRQDIARGYDQAKQDQARLEGELAAEAALGRHLQDVLDPAKVLESLKRLNQVLGENNATLTNLELARHIERIDCYSDGRVVLRGTYLGLFEGAVELLSAPDDGTAITTTPEIPYGRVRPRRLTRRKVPELTEQGSMAQGVDGLDPSRFKGLAEAFMFEETLMLPDQKFWFEEHAAELVALWATDPKRWTPPRLAAHFGVTPPTARKALRFGQASAGIQVDRKVVRRGVEDHRDLADEAGRLYLRTDPRPLGIKAIAKVLNVNQVTISKALDYFFELRGQKRPDGRSVRSVRPTLPSVPIPNEPSGVAGEPPVPPPS